MEEIITVDGRQFKLTADRSLTAEEKVQTIAEIKKQTGCGTCGPRVARMGNDWQYGGVRSLVDTNYSGSACTTGVKYAGNVLTLTAQPIQGVAPYTLDFRRSMSGDYSNIMVSSGVVGDYRTTTYSIPGNRLSGTIVGNPVSPINELQIVTKYYALDTTDINEATSRVSLEGPSLLFGAAITDSCSPAQTCVSFCKVLTGCPSPICDFTVA